MKTKTQKVKLEITLLSAFCSWQISHSGLFCSSCFCIMPSNGHPLLRTLECTLCRDPHVEMGIEELQWLSSDVRWGTSPAKDPLTIHCEDMTNHQGSHIMVSIFSSDLLPRENTSPGPFLQPPTITQPLSVSHLSSTIIKTKTYSNSSINAQSLHKVM